jgi:hypothetical protein
LFVFLAAVLARDTNKSHLLFSLANLDVALYSLFAQLRLEEGGGGRRKEPTHAITLTPRN